MIVYGILYFMLTPKSIQNRILRNMGLLGLVLLIGAVYICWMAYVGALTGSSRVDGSIGILLGLYICSHPAANMLDMLMFMTADIRESILATRTGWIWLFMNLLAFLVAWAVIFSGILRFVSR